MITRAQIRRQLRKNGGIMNTVPRTGFFLGGIKDRIRKLIPNEIANVASKAAPFVAPFNPGIAGLMRGIGRFDKRGSLSDALKQGLLTTAGGAGARYLGGQRGIEDIMGGGLRGGLTNPISSDSPLRNLFKSKELSEKEKILKRIKDEKSIDKTPKFMEKLRKLTIDKAPILGNLNPMVQQKLLVGGITAGASALYDFFAEQELPQQDGETVEQFMERRRVSVGRKMRNYMDNYFKFDAEYSALDDAGRDAFVARYNMKQGGRVGLAMGSPHGQEMPTFSEGVPQMFMSDERGALPKAEGGVSPEDMGILSVDDFDNVENYRRYINKLIDDQEFTGAISDKERDFVTGKLGRLRDDQEFTGAISEKELKLMENLKFLIKMRDKGMINKNLTDEDLINTVFRNMKTNNKAQGGRIKKYGGGVTAAMPKIPTGTPRVNAGGISELDYRAKGGFVPVGVKEKADDVPAMLSKNEFVMTADAVKGAGGGNVEKGAQKMYNTMKRLEGRVA